MTLPRDRPIEFQSGGGAALRPHASATSDAVSDGPLSFERLLPQTGVIVFGVMGALVATYLVWLIVNGPKPPQAGWMNGWALDAFYLLAAIVCVIGGLRRRPGSLIPVVFGLALICTMLGNTILTVYALHGMPPPPPTAADIFGLGFIVLCFVGIGLMARKERERLNPRDLLDGGIAALGTGAVCAAFVLAQLPHRQGQSVLGSAVILAYPIGFVILVVIVVGAATVASERRSRVAWVALAAAFALVAVPSAVSASTTAPSPTAFSILNLVAWPTAMLVLAGSMWADPGVNDPAPVSRGTVVWIPAVACAAAIAVLIAATVRKVDHTATVLAAAAVLLVMLRGYNELRHEMAARARTEEGLRESDAQYRQVAEEQAALRRVATLVAAGVPPTMVFGAVAEEVGRLLAVEGAFVVRYEQDGMVTVVAASGATNNSIPVGLRRPVVQTSLSWLLRENGSAARIDYADDPVAVEYGITSSVAAPITVEGRLWGYIAASTTRDRLPPETEARLAGFTDLVATAIANAESRAQLMESRARIVAAADEARRRIERDLHDGAQQSLMSAALKLKLAEQASGDGAEKAKRLIHEAAESTEQAIEEMGELARGIHPAVLARSGLTPALKTLARRSPIPVVLDVRAPTRLPEPAEVTAYFVISEALTNAAKHSAASEVRVLVAATDDKVRLSVDDDGVGGARLDSGSGLVGLSDRVEAAGGTLVVQSPLGEGTHLAVELPLVTS